MKDSKRANQALNWIPKEKLRSTMDMASTDIEPRDRILKMSCLKGVDRSVQEMDYKTCKSLVGQMGLLLQHSTFLRNYYEALPAGTSITHCSMSTCYLPTIPYNHIQLLLFYN